MPNKQIRQTNSENYIIFAESFSLKKQSYYSNLMKELISIIVPVYNNEKTLRRCVSSLLDQMYPHIEVLLIDDGSTDLSGQICEEYALKDQRVRVFHKPNGGESSARNFGLNNVKGSWVTFCDADDFVGRSYIFSFLYRKRLDKDCLYITGEREGFSENDLKQVRGIYYSGQVDQEMLDKLQKNGTVWGKLFNRKTINRIRLRFNENIFYGDDKLFMMQYLKEMKEVAYNRKYFPYNYINNFSPKKFMHDFSKQRINYRANIDGLKLAWPENCKPSWFTIHFKLIFFSVFYENVSKAQKIKNLATLRDDQDTKIILEELIKNGGKLKIIWKMFLKRKYKTLCTVCTPAVRTAVNIFAKEGNIALKKFLKKTVHP